MSLDDFSDFVAYSKQHFEEGLIRGGFVERDGRWIGSVDHSGGSTEVIISLPSRFPFKPPRVVPADNDQVAWSWHREIDGALCLVADDDHHDLWWTEASAFLEHIMAWFEGSDAGWVDDRHDLDLDRYFEPAEDKRLYLYGDLDEYRNELVRFARAPNGAMRLLGKGTRPVKAAKKHLADVFGYVADLGDIDGPPRSWDDVAARIEPNVNLERRIREHSISILVLIYNRGEHEGAIVLEVWPTMTGGIAVRRLLAGADTAAAKSARSGPRAPDLNSRRVAVIGVGALGSFIADMLIRSGVRNLTLVDGDIVMPGNLVRHLVGPESVALPKATAVKNHLMKAHDLEPSQIEVQTEAVTAGDTAIELLRGHDLVINATADFSITALFRKAAEALNTNLLSTALKNDGNTYRIDVLPPLGGASSIPDSTWSPARPGLSFFEAGCGSPISPTPPHAVIEAAAATVRHAVGLLLDDPVHPAGEVRNLMPEPVVTP